MQIITIIGNLTRNPELHGENAARQFCTFTVAVNSQKRNSKDASLMHSVTYYNVRVWGEQGRSCYKYLSKGRKVSVIGNLDVSLAEDSAGKPVLNQAGRPIINLDVNASFVEFLGGTIQQGNSETDGADAASGKVVAPPPAPVYSDELPF